MCLAIPSQIEKINEDNTAIVNTMGVRRLVSLELLGEPVKEGDWVLIHVGFAISKLNEEEALKALELFEEILEMEEQYENY
ncbi:hydrogenase assembly protein HupF [Thermocrinis ruber]|jgi:hydrogenase expression/formation protein HypC|uniref:Hydrogenase assembly protein HupF n=1 Tax=Thermocrinis ruber TaxID=75906 RepID=W0DC19_9AQUI|nr:HypC/HybG/HupF family hydrogenase formation chaperone [Thermocrinis ruber]AHE96094.1 hydrogenase assembly protein HupF [Thermocrinis ruber]